MYIPLRVQSSFSMLESTIELKALANYIGSLPGSMATVPQAKFR